MVMIIRGLSALGFPAVAGIALQNQRPIGVKPQRIAEIGPRRVKFERRDGVVAHRIEPVHSP